MLNGRVIFFFVLLAIVIAIARYNSPRSNPAPAVFGVAPSPGGSQSPAAIAMPSASASVSPAQLAAATSPAAAPSASPVAAQTPAAQPSISPSVALQKTVPRAAHDGATISVFASSW